MYVHQRWAVSGAVVEFKYILVPTDATSDAPAVLWETGFNRRLNLTNGMACSPTSILAGSSAKNSSDASANSSKSLAPPEIQGQGEVLGGNAGDGNGVQVGHHLRQ